MTHIKHALESAITSWFLENPVKKALLGYVTGFAILLLLLVLVQFLIAREKKVRKLKKIEVGLVLWVVFMATK